MTLEEEGLIATVLNEERRRRPRRGDPDRAFPPRRPSAIAIVEENEREIDGSTSSWSGLAACKVGICRTEIPR